MVWSNVTYDSAVNLIEKHNLEDENGQCKLFALKVEKLSVCDDGNEDMFWKLYADYDILCEKLYNVIAGFNCDAQITVYMVNCQRILNMPYDFDMELVEMDSLFIPLCKEKRKKLAT